MPTRFIDTPEFNELMRAEGSTVPLFRLDAVTFNPPRPKEPYAGETAVGINVLLLNVVEPVIYKDGAGIAYIILNAYDDENVMTYESLQDAHPVKGAWFYRLAPSYWRAVEDNGDFFHELEDVRIVFNHGEEEN